METLEVPITEESNELSSWPDIPPVNFVEQAIDLAAFKLWGEASGLDSVTDDDAADNKGRV